ncbi:MAG: L,D-transpeptidase family protein [bacterium]
MTPKKSYLMIIFVAAVVAMGLLAVHPEKIHAAQLLDRVSASLCTRLFLAEDPARIICQQESLAESERLLAFFQRRGFRPAWLAADGPRPEAFALLLMLEDAGSDGLRATDYHLAALAAALPELSRKLTLGELVAPAKLADLDLLLTDALLLFAAHLSAGKADPQTMQEAWHIPGEPLDIVARLERALAAGVLFPTLRALRPESPGYHRLRESLARYRDLAASGGWLVLAEGKLLEQGMRHPRVAELRSRLLAEGDLLALTLGDPNHFDALLEQAVLGYQQRRGLPVDGKVGPMTVAALNVPVTERIRQLELNLERMRWLPRDLGPRYIVVNIPGFDLQVIEDGQTVASMGVVVGSEAQPTPIFSRTMTYLELNPYWNIPRRLVTREILPLVQRDPEYLVERNIRVYAGWQSDSAEVPSEAIDWSGVDPETHPYRFRQDPGVKNSLGRIKFMFPNQFNVYLHDTPSTSLFARARRAFSHGCIRLERPLELATYLLQEEPFWTRSEIMYAIASGENLKIGLPRPLPVFLVYLTAWVDENGATNFREDIYGRDESLQVALNQPPAGLIQPDATEVVELDVREENGAPEEPVID